jgi:acyl-CoA reductase-like NAD-dependent aldehyde dehydrogenase
MQNNLFKSKIENTKILTSFLLTSLKLKKNTLLKKNIEITNDTDQTVLSDYIFTEEYVANYLTNHSKELQSGIKQKGKILIVLSYNEPIIMSVVPIMNALIAGNDVYVKPSSKCINLFKLIWNDDSFPKKIKNKIKIIEVEKYTDLERHVKNMDCVYFFGSETVAKEVYKYCANHFVEFIPEIETADPKVYYIPNATEKEIYEDCITTIKSSISHAGQMCERVCGVYIHEDNYKVYTEKIKQACIDLVKSKEVHESIRVNFKFNEKSITIISNDIDQSLPEEVIGKSGEGFTLVINPNKNSKLVHNGYFYPLLWLIPFKDKNQIIKLLKNRRYFLGINLMIKDERLINKIIKNTRFTRYTTNSNHEKVGTSEGWGGNWPSGSGGYKSWLEHFSVKYTLI